MLMNVYVSSSKQSGVGVKLVDGLIEGEDVGKGVLGVDDGLGDGEFVGFDEGLNDGFKDGATLGSTLGTSVGRPDGNTDGLELGIIVGDTDGDNDGLSVAQTSKNLRHAARHLNLISCIMTGSSLLHHTSSLEGLFVIHAQSLTLPFFRNV